MTDRRLMWLSPGEVVRDAMKPSELAKWRGLLEEAAAAGPATASDAAPRAAANAKSQVTANAGAERGDFRSFPTFEDAKSAARDAGGPSVGPASTSAIADDRLTPQQRLAVGILLCGGTLASCAAKVGVSVRTLYNWRHDPVFADQLNARSGEAIEAACMRARSLMLASTEVLARSLHGEDAPKWAARVLQLRGVWRMAQVLPEPAAQAPATSAGTVLDAGTPVDAGISA